MVNKAATIYWAVAGQLARWVRTAIRMAHLVASALVSALKRVGVNWISASALPAMWQQFLDSTIELRGQPGQSILEVGKGVMSVELGRLQKAHHHCGTLAGQLAAHEQPIAPIQCPGPDLVLDVIVVHGDCAVTQKLRERLPVVQAVVDRLGNRAALRHPSAFKSQPGVQLFPQRLALALTSSSNFLRA